MSLKITVQEEARVFTVSVGRNEIGKVTSYFEKGEDNKEVYHAQVVNDAKEKDDYDFSHVGWHPTLKEAIDAVVEYSHGPGKIDNITERVV